MRLARSIVVSMAAAAVLITFSSAHSKEDGSEKATETAEPLEISITALEMDEEDASEPVCVPEKIIRMPPAFPNKCSKIRGKEHFVTLRFDINEKGAPIHIETIDQSNRCFVPTARLAVRKWRYSCEYFGREDVETRISFHRM